MSSAAATMTTKRKGKAMGKDLELVLMRSAPVGGFCIDPMSPNERAEWDAAVIAARVAEGFKPLTAKLLTWPSSNVKLDKSNAYGLSLSQASTSGFNVCRSSTCGCRATCLASAGKGSLSSVQRGRIWKTKLLASHPHLFVKALATEIRQAVIRHDGAVVPIRFNTLSDLAFERFAPELLNIYGIQPYDYTKRTDRTPPPNYHLTMSASERYSDADLIGLAGTYAAGTVAVVFSTKRNHALPSTFAGLPVVDGDVSDSRWNDGTNVIVGLRAKGAAIGDRSGFVRSVV